MEEMYLHLQARNSHPRARLRECTGSQRPSSEPESGWSHSIGVRAMEYNTVKRERESIPCTRLDSDYDRRCRWAPT